MKKGKKAKEAYQKAKITFRNEAKAMGMIIGTKLIFHFLPAVCLLQCSKSKQCLLVMGYDEKLCLLLEL